MEPVKCWAIVLAGGEGRRMSSAVCEWLGEDCPKQYCTFVGTRSMLQHTWDRCAQIADESRLLTVIGAGHKRFMERRSCPRIRGTVIEQPCARGTLPGLLLPLTYVMAQDPRAVVHVFPADHYVFPETRFRRIARASALLASCRPDRMVLMGARPDSPEVDYGWVKTFAGDGARTRVLGVASFFEKPPRETAEKLFEEGGYWNTMIIASRARLIWDLARKIFPQMMERFEELRQMIATARVQGINPNSLRRTVEWVYDGIVAADLSRHILQKAPERLLLLAMDQVDWSDWGRPGRIEDTLRRLGKAPYFAETHPRTAASLMSTVPAL